VGRDSLFGEAILWAGKPARLRVPALLRVAAVAAAVVSASTLALAVVAARSLGAHVQGMLGLSAWCATLALAAWRLPLWWQAGVEYLITERHVIWRRGRLRRTIDRSTISFARIVWRDGGVGDLVLVRAVPTGALRRTLSLTLGAVKEPDRVWALVRGVEPGGSFGDGTTPLAQRLDPGERVLWSGHPVSAAWTVRRVVGALAGAVLLAAFVHGVARAATPVARVLGLHTLGPAMGGLFVGGVALAMLLLLFVAATLFDWAVLRPGRLVRRTRYFVTDRRVLIQRGHEELHLDRSRIAYVIAAPTASRSLLRDVFLVLDGPQARALAASGAFGERSRDTLEPVLFSIADADTVEPILRAYIHSPN
jgi:hypothetical protein